jgi:disulfide bond formation protein DsbB
LSTQTVSTFFALSAIVILAVAAILAVVWAAAGRSGTAAGWRDTVVASLGHRSLTYAWVVALTATLGSLYYSEIAGFIPCEFCWYQRIAMYPLAVVLGIAAYRKDRAFWRYGLPVVAIGSALSAYHYLIQWFPGLAASSCSATAPCTGRWVWEFGLVSIPFMALACFVAIGWLLIIGRTAAADSD